MDPFDLFEADQASGQPSQTKDNIGMERAHYDAAAKGDIEHFKKIPNPHINLLLTPNRNTILHIYLTSLKESESKDSKSSTEFVEEILTKCSILLWQANVKGETLLHIAARYGHAAIVDVLIEHARAPQEDLENGVNNAAVQKLLEMTNNEKDTALHEAVRNNHLEVVKKLIKKGPTFSYSQNDAGETPLYMAVERGFKKVMVHILDNCTSPAHDGPLGRTTLHAALIWNAALNWNDTDNLLENNKAHQELSRLIKQADKHGWTPLHYAAYFNCDIVEKLLDVDRSIAYMQDAKGVTALHIAAHRDHDTILQKILKYCPDCCELVDENGWNALHFAMNASTENAIQVILTTSTLSNLLNEKDATGNTPLHCHSKLLECSENLKLDNRFDLMAFNKQNLDVYDIALKSEELSYEKYKKITSIFNRPVGFRRLLGDDLKSNRKDDQARAMQHMNDKWKSSKDRFVFIMEKTSKTHLVVDTLIATVTFAAGITMPGGFIGQEGPHPGSAVLTRNTSYRAFVITNTIAMVQSCSAAFIQLFMPLLFRDKDRGEFSFLLASLAFFLSISAMGAMVLAFVTATYAVLMYSLDLAIANCVIGLCFFIPFLFISIKCRKNLGDIYEMGDSWIFRKVKFFYDVNCCVLLCICRFMCGIICGKGCAKCCSWHGRRTQTRRNVADQSTES